MVRKTPTCTGPQLVALAVLALVTLQQTEGFQANVRSPIHGQVASPNYTELFYPDRIDETIRLETLPGHRIVVYFADFNIEETGDDASKWGDYVEVRLVFEVCVCIALPLNVIKSTQISVSLVFEINSFCCISLFVLIFLT